MFSDDARSHAARVLARYRAAGWRLATAESCTGGLIAGLLTDIAGSSDVVDRGFVTYSDKAKIEMLGVPAALLAGHGAVSAPVARAMASGALARSDGVVAIAVTGIAGPGGASAEKPLGLVHCACAVKGGPVAAERHVFPGDRAAVRHATVRAALGLLEAV